MARYYFESVEFTLVTDKLDLPFSTIFILTVINITIILSHTLYRKIDASIKTSRINDFLIKYNFNIRDVKFWYILSIIAVASKLFFFDLNKPISAQGEFGYNPNILQDIINGFKFLIFLPIVIFFSKSLFEIDHIPKKIYFLFYFYFQSYLFHFLEIIDLFFYFDYFLLFTIVIFILIVFGKIDLKNFL